MFAAGRPAAGTPAAGTPAAGRSAAAAPALRFLQAEKQKRRRYTPRFIFWVGKQVPAIGQVARS